MQVNNNIFKVVTMQIENEKRPFRKSDQNLTAISEKQFFSTRPDITEKFEAGGNEEVNRLHEIRSKEDIL